MTNAVAPDQLVAATVTECLFQRGQPDTARNLDVLDELCKELAAGGEEAVCELVGLAVAVLERMGALLSRDPLEVFREDFVEARQDV